MTTIHRSEASSEAMKTHTQMLLDGRDEQMARAFFARIELRRNTEAAVREYELRVAEGRPYEDAVSVDELARLLGR